MSHHPHIMVVCDTAGDRSILQDVLADLAEVSLGDSGEQAVGNAQAWQPDLLLLGAALPDMTGTQALAALKKDIRTSSIPVLMMVDRDDADTESRLLIQGAADVLHLPLRAEAVRSRVELQLSLARSARRQPDAEKLQQQVQEAAELVDELHAIAQMASEQVAAGRSAESLLAHLQSTAQHLRRILAPGQRGDTPEPTQPGGAPAIPGGATAGEDHLWLPLDPQKPPSS